MVVERRELLDDAMEMLLIENDHVIQTFPAQGSHTSLANSIHVGGAYRRANLFDTSPERHCRELLSKLAVIVSDQVFRSFTPRRGLS